MEGEGRDEVDTPGFAPFPHRPMIRSKYAAKTLYMVVSRFCHFSSSSSPFTLSTPLSFHFPPHSFLLLPLSSSSSIPSSALFLFSSLLPPLSSLLFLLLPQLSTTIVQRCWVTSNVRHRVYSTMLLYREASQR